MKHYLIQFLLIILPAISLAQSPGEELMTWNANRKLNWNDYKANPDPTTGAAATTTTYLTIEYKMSNESFQFKIKSFFSKDLSWGLHRTDYILQHEQGHFDIAEIFARKLYKEMSSYVFNKRTYQKDLNKIYEGVVQEKTDFQNNYDRETNHSIDKEKQAMWLVKIKNLLREYEDFAGY